MGGRPRKPTKLLLLSGAAKNHPERLRQRAQEPEPDAGLGEPPDYFDAADRERWEELVAIVPAGVLTRMDRPAAETLCRLWARERRGDLKTSDRRLLVSLFGKFGLTPSERSKVHAPGGAKRPANRFAGLG